MDFSITTRLNKKDYIKVMYAGLYRKPFYIVAGIFGLSLITISVLNYFYITDFDVYSPLIDAVLGLLFLLFPSLIVMLSVSQLKSNPSILQDITYGFTESGMTVAGLTFKSEFSWEHIIKQKEIGKFLLLYHTKKFGNFIDKSKLSAEQLVFIKSKIIMK